jgi:simple sugar transport system permease protein
LNKPSTRSLVEGLRITGIGGSDVHWGLVLGIGACLVIGLWLAYTASGFSVRVVGGNPRTAQLVGLPANRLVLLACAIGGACAGTRRRGRGRRGHTNANASLIAGYGYAGILVAFIARQSPFAIIPVAILFGGFGAAGSLLQRRLGLPDASVQVLQGIAFVLILASEALRGLDWIGIRGKLRRPPQRDPSPAALDERPMLHEIEEKARVSAPARRLRASARWLRPAPSQAAAASAARRLRERSGPRARC